VGTPWEFTLEKGQERGMKILVVEDSSTLRFVVKTALSQLTVEIGELNDGLEALEYFQMGGKGDLIICDVNMPNISGIDLLKQLRDKKLAEGVPFIFLTTEQCGELIAEAKKLKAQGWLRKPVEAEKLLEAVNRFLPAASA